MKNPQIHQLTVIRLLKGRDKRRLIEKERALLEERLHKHLDTRCIVAIEGGEIHVGIRGRFTKDELAHKASGVQRIWEWEAV